MISDSEFQELIRKKEYKKKEFHGQKTNLVQIAHFIRTMKVDKESFTFAYEIIQFFRSPILIAFKPFYEKIEKNINDYKDEYEIQIQEIASYVKAYTDIYKLEELQFFFIFGEPKKARVMNEMSSFEKEFLVYIEKLSKHISKIKKEIKNIDPDKLKLELDMILAENLQRKLNTFEAMYEQYFKNEADKIYNENQQKFEASSDYFIDQRKGIENRPELDVEEKDFLCCRTSFIDQQRIFEPENLTIEYKSFLFPFNDTHFKILRKTICAFLNSDGGTIYLGIQEDIESKKRKVLGMQLNEAEQEELLFSLRKEVIESIQPDILTNKMYWVSFVPVKTKDTPKKFISGRYVVKIIIKYGQRDEIYSYRQNDRDYFAFRTENEVVHREGRDVLRACQERIRAPLEIPKPIHEGPCKLPEEGKPITGIEKFHKIKQAATNSTNFVSHGPEKTKFKEKEAADFIVLDISEAELKEMFKNEEALESIRITFNQSKRICKLKVKSEHEKYILIEFLCKMESNSKYEFFEVQRGIVFNDKISFDYIFEILKGAQLNFKYYDKNRSKLEFSTTDECIEAFLQLRVFEIKTSFESV